MTIFKKKKEGKMEENKETLNKNEKNKVSSEKKE